MKPKMPCIVQLPRGSEELRVGRNKEKRLKRSFELWQFPTYNMWLTTGCMQTLLLPQWWASWQQINSVPSWKQLGGGGGGVGYPPPPPPSLRVPGWMLLQGRIGIQFCWVPSHCGLYWKEISDKLAKGDAMKNMSEISYNNLQLLYHETASILQKDCVLRTWKK